MMPKSTDFLCGDVADNLLLYKDNYTFYQALPFLEFTEDATTCLPISSTPDRAQRCNRSLWPDVPAYRDAHPPITNTPRSFVTPSTSSLSMAMVFSPSPLPVSQVPSLVFPEISPPSQGSGSTPFERQFVGDFSREWSNINTQISPVIRRDSRSPVFYSPAFSNACGTPFRTHDDPTSQDSQGAVGRVSLIDRFISAAADESATTENDTPFSTFPYQDRSSPLSDLSDLTSLSSSDHFGCELDLRSSSPPTSPIAERHKDPRRSNTRYNHQPPNSRRQPSPSQSTRKSARSRDSDYQPAKGTTRCKRKRISPSRDGDEIPTRRKKTRTARIPEPTSTDANSSLGTLTRRRLPINIPYHPEFSLLYLRFPVSSYLPLADGKFSLLSADPKLPAGIYNEPRDALDLYTPRFVKGCGATKVGVCPICIEPPSRGGKGETVWLSMKFSAYKVVFFTGKILIGNASSYHLQYAHGISSVSARPFSPPVAFRTIERPNPAKNERTSIQEGKCHKCKKWIFVQSIKNIDIKVKELYWWKHAAACHQGTHLEGDDDFFLDDEIYRRAQQAL